MPTNESNSELNISLFLRRCTIFQGIATGTNDFEHCICAHSVHYSCLIVRLNPIIQRKYCQRKNENQKKRNADSITFSVFMKSLANGVGNETCSDNDSIRTLSLTIRNGAEMKPDLCLPLIRRRRGRKLQFPVQKMQ